MCQGKRLRPHHAAPERRHCREHHPTRHMAGTQRKSSVSLIHPKLSTHWSRYDILVTNRSCCFQHMFSCKAQPAAQRQLHGSDVFCISLWKISWEMIGQVCAGVSSDPAHTHTHGASIVFCFLINPPSQGLLSVPFSASQPSAPVCQTRHKPSVLPLRAGRLITIFG